jgi:hypothetical protein
MTQDAVNDRSEALLSSVGALYAMADQGYGCATPHDFQTYLWQVVGWDVVSSEEERIALETTPDPLPPPTIPRRSRYKRKPVV